MSYWEADLMQGQDRSARVRFTLRRRAGFPAHVTRHSPVLEGADRLGKLFQQIAGDHGLGTELTAGEVPGQPVKVDPHHGAYGRPDHVYPGGGTSYGGYSGGYGGGYGSRSDWCRSNYRSYDPRTGYYRAYSGRLVYCG